MDINQYVFKTDVSSLLGAIGSDMLDLAYTEGVAGETRSGYQS